MVAPAHCQRYQWYLLHIDELTRLSSCFDCLLDDNGARMAPMRQHARDDGSNIGNQQWQRMRQYQQSTTRMPIPVRKVAKISKKNSCRQARSEGARVQFFCLHLNEFNSNVVTCGTTADELPIVIRPVFFMQCFPKPKLEASGMISLARSPVVWWKYDRCTSDHWISCTPPIWQDCCYIKTRTA